MHTMIHSIVALSVVNLVKIIRSALILSMSLNNFLHKCGCCYRILGNIEAKMIIGLK